LNYSTGLIQFAFDLRLPFVQQIVCLKAKIEIKLCTLHRGW